jgi:hypothetical protein
MKAGDKEQLEVSRAKPIASAEAQVMQDKG